MRVTHFCGHAIKHVPIDKRWQYWQNRARLNLSGVLVEVWKNESRTRHAADPLIDFLQVMIVEHQVNYRSIDVCMPSMR